MRNENRLATSTASLLLATAVGIFAACSSDPVAGVTAPAADSGPADDIDSSTIGKEGGPVADSGPSPEGSTPTTKKTGAVTLTYYDTATAHSLFGAAGFSDQAPSAKAPTCTTTTEGACVVQDCVIPAGVDAGPAPVAVTAGPIAITGGSIPAGYKLTANGAGVYSPSAIPMNPAWFGGEDITFTASGGDVPAFTTKLKSPAALTLTSALPATWDSTMKEDVTWSGAGVNSVKVALTKSSTTNPVFVVCTFAASALTGHIPAAALPKLKGSVGYSLSHVDDVPVTAGGYAVEITIRTYLRATASANGLATGIFTVN